MADVIQIIENAARRHGVPVEALLAIGKIESNFKAGADNPSSSASGLFQFTNATAREYGLTGDKRNDISAQADAAARMAAQNSRSLERAIGRTPTAGELYLAHQQGLAGAKALIRNPDKPAIDVLRTYHGDRAASVIRQNGGNLNQTAGQFANRWITKGNSVARQFPGTTKTAPTPASMPAALRDRLTPAALAAIESATGTKPGASQMAYAGMPPALSAAVQKVQETSVPKAAPQPRDRIKRAEPTVIADTMASLEKARLAGPNAGDSIALDPWTGANGGKLLSPDFDGVYDERRQGMVRQPPAGTWGMGTVRSAPPMSKGAMSYAGQERGLGTASKSAITPQSVRQAADIRALRAAENAAARDGVGQPPATRVVQSVPVAKSGGASDRVRDNEWQTKNEATTVATYPTSRERRYLPELPPSTLDQELASTPRPRPRPNTTAVVAEYPTVPQAPSAFGSYEQGGKAPNKSSGNPVNVAGYPVAPPVPDRLAEGHRDYFFDGEDLTAKVAPRPFDRPNFGIGGGDIEVKAPPVLPDKQQLEAATGFRTVTKTERVINPAWEAYRAANPAQKIALNSPVPLGEMTYKGSRDSKAQMEAGQKFVQTKMPEKWITKEVTVKVPVAAPKAPKATPKAQPKPGAIAPKIAPVPIAPFAPFATAPNMQMGLISSMLGSQRPGSFLGNLLGSTSRAPIGAFLGVAANGGAMVQGHGGVANSITQNSDYWKVATGQKNQGQSNGDAAYSYRDEDGGASSLTG